MVVPVWRALQSYPGIRAEILACTSAGPILQSQGIPFRGYKDFLRPEDKAALEWGMKLAATEHNPESGIALDESVAYLGMCYWDLVTRHGDEEAAQRWHECGRRSFQPLTMLERIIAEIDPAMVIVTSAPRSEAAAVQVANELGIPTLCMVDLFGMYHFHRIESQYITTLCAATIGNLVAAGGQKPEGTLFITGNPAFDRVVEYRGAINYAWRHTHLKGIPDRCKTLLWIDVPAFWKRGTDVVHVRSEAEIVSDLAAIHAAVRENGGCLLVRPHPSQRTEVYRRWISGIDDSQARLASNLPLYPTLNAVDAVATYNSTVGVEAVLMLKQVIQPVYVSGGSDLPLAELGLARQVRSPQEWGRVIGEAFAATESNEVLQAKVSETFPPGKAAPRIAALIRSLLGLDEAGCVREAGAGRTDRRQLGSPE